MEAKLERESEGEVGGRPSEAIPNVLLSSPAPCFVVVVVAAPSSRREPRNCFSFTRLWRRQSTTRS